MAAAYTREFLIEAFASRYEPLGLKAVESQYQLAAKLYDSVGKDEFRRYCSLDAVALRAYKEKMGA